MTDKTEVEAELAALRERVAELERAAKPPLDIKRLTEGRKPPPNPIDRMSMPPSVVREMCRATPDNLVRAIAADRYATTPVSQVQSEAPTGKPVNTTGWRETPLTPPPGIALADRLLDVQDAKDRAELIAGEARRRMRR
jgi:hypothetical protein